MPSLDSIEKMANASLYLGYKEIAGAIAMSQADGSDPSTRLKEVPRSASHAQYLARAGKETFPAYEFKTIAKFAEEAGQLRDLNKDISALSERQIEALRLANVTENHEWRV